METLAVQPACSNCRKRKTRCDRQSPCAPCRAANLPCQTETQRTKVHTRRVQVSKQYEDKIDSIDQRLANIELLLQQSASNQPSPSTHPPSAPQVEQDQSSVSHATVTTQFSASEDGDDPNPDPSAAGYIGAQVEFTAATSVLDHTITRDPDLQHDPELAMALQSIHGIVDHKDFSADDSGHGTAHKAPPDSINPEWEQVRAVLERAKNVKPMLFNLYSEEMYDTFRRKCQKIYQHGHDGTPSEKLLVYSGLSNVCSEFTSETDDFSASYAHNLKRAFTWLLMDTLSTFPLLVHASIETLEALLLAALTMIGMCKPSLAWSLICKASQICQKLGYNRLASSTSNSDAQYSRKVFLFWAIYAIDRNISFRLGQAPSIQEYDIDTPLTLENDQRHPSAREFMTFWVDCGRVQGKICTQLYSPAASNLTDEERARVAHNLAQELEKVYQRKRESNEALMSAFVPAHISMHTDAWLHSDAITHYSTLSTALYAIPPTQPGHTYAIDAARQCLRLTRDLSNRYFHNVFDWTTCCHWILLHGPLTSFTGVFYTILANPSSSEEDLQLLEDFVASLQPARQFSDSIEKFYKLCCAFTTIARAYVRIKCSKRSNLTSQETSQPALWTCSGSAEDPGQTTAATFEEQQAQQFLEASQNFQEWYTGNASLYTLLEQDLDGFDLFGGS